MNINNLVNEWFYRLENGYATPPYSKTELDILKEILQEYSISNWQSVLAYMAEAESDDQLDSNDDETVKNVEPETHESNEDFRNLLDSFEQFSDIINKRYITPGVNISGLDDLYNHILELPDSLQDHMRRLIGKRTNRDIYNGTFKMGQYEKILLDTIQKTIKIENIKNEVFWFAIVLDGMLKPNALDSNTPTGNVIVQESHVLISNFQNEIISFGVIDPELASLLTILINLGEVIDGEKSEELSKASLNSLLDKLIDEENKQELEQFLNLSNVTKLSALKSLSNTIKTSLENHDINELPSNFCKMLDQYISKILSTISYWGTIRGDMVYLTTGQSLYPSLNCTKEGKLGGGIYGIQDNKLRVLGDVINEKLI